MLIVGHSTTVGTIPLSYLRGKGAGVVAGARVVVVVGASVVGAAVAGARKKENHQIDLLVVKQMVK